jgi:hypothetical protein
MEKLFPRLANEKWHVPEWVDSGPKGADSGPKGVDSGPKGWNHHTANNTTSEGHAPPRKHHDVDEIAQSLLRDDNASSPGQAAAVGHNSVEVRVP